MKNIPILIILFSIFTGCSTFRTMGDDYLKGDELGEGRVEQALHSLKYDYLNAGQPVLDVKRKTEVLQIAQRILFESSYKNDYSALTYEFDEGIRMPETFAYIFVHFFPNADKMKIMNTTYLVVIDRQSDRVAYHDVYSPPKGDSFYRYNDILKKIQK